LTYKLIAMLDSIYDQILEFYGDADQLLFADGFNEAIIGISTKTAQVVYSQRKIIDILKREMDEDEATEFFYYNILDAYVGEHTPIFVYDIWD
jgi:hypothetical protein